MENHWSTSNNKLFLLKLFSPNSNNGFHQPKTALIKTQFPQDRILDINKILHSGQWKRIFCLVEKAIFLFRALLNFLKLGCVTSCLWKLIFWLVEFIFSHFSDTPSSESYFLYRGNVLLNESSNPNDGDASSFMRRPFSLI